MDTNIIEENGIVTIKFRLPKNKGRVSQSGKTVNLGNARVPLVTGNCIVQIHVYEPNKSG